MVVSCNYALDGFITLDSFTRSVRFIGACIFEILTLQCALHVSLISGKIDAKDVLFTEI